MQGILQDLFENQPGSRTSLMYGNSVIMDFLYILKNNENTIIRMIGFLENMIQKNIKKNKGLCLCHGDIHAGNIFIEENKFYVVDWDTIIMAPKEKDLMFIGGGIGSKWNRDEEIEYFYKGYGKELGIDKDLIKYYRYERIIQDIYEFYQQIIDIETTEEKRKECLKSFKETFEPNNVVDIASRT